MRLRFIVMRWWRWNHYAHKDQLPWTSANAWRGGRNYQRIRRPNEWLRIDCYQLGIANEVTWTKNFWTVWKPWYERIPTPREITTILPCRMLRHLGRVVIGIRRKRTKLFASWKRFVASQSIRSLVNRYGCWLGNGNYFAICLAGRNQTEHFATLNCPVTSQRRTARVVCPVHWLFTNWFQLKVAKWC